MAEIEIFLSIDEMRISFLSIPCSDIERLAVLPFQWIRYVMFAICGARGDLCTTPNGPAVAYEDAEIANDKYYYRPSGKLSFCARDCSSVSRLLQVIVPLWTMKV